MRVSIVSALELPEKDVIHANERVRAPEHQNDGGARPAWLDPNWRPKLFVAYVEVN